MAEQTDPFEGTGSLNIEQPDNSFGDITTVEHIQQALPQFRGKNPYSLKRKLMEDGDFFNEVSEEFFTRPSPNEFRRLQQQDPEAYESRLNNFRNNMRLDFEDTSFAGEDERETLINRTISLTSDASSLPVEQYKSIIENNPDAFKRYGVLDDEGNVQFGDDTTSSLTLGQTILQNEDFHKQLEFERYKQFENELAKSHNQTSKLRDDLGLLSQAYVAYSHYGGEGLTQFVNWAQWGDADESIGQRFKQGREAEEWLRQSRLGELTKEFFEGGDEPLTFQPVTARRELEVDVAEDWNQYTQNWKDGFFEDKDPKGVYDYFLDTQVPETYKPFMDSSNVGELGNYSEEDKQLSWAVLDRAIHEDGFTVDDLMNTVLANSEHDTETRAVQSLFDRLRGKTTEAPEGVYRFNYKELPESAKVAVNALHHHNEIGNMIRRTDQEGVYELVPSSYENDWDWWKEMQKRFVGTKTVGRRRPDGTTEFTEVPEGGLLNTAWKATVGTGLAAGHTLYKFAYEPAVRATALTMDKLGVGDTQAGLSYSDTVRGRAQTSIFDVLTGDDEMGSGSMGVAMAGDMVQYMGAMFMGGRALMTLGTKGLQSITGVKKSTDLINYGNHLFGSPRVAGMSLKLSNALKNKSPWATGFGVWYSGGALVEATQPAQASFYELIPEVLGYEQTNDVRQFYRNANSAGKVAMDIGASLMLDSFADNLVALGKLGTGKAAQKFWGRDKFKSLDYVEPRFDDNGQLVQGTGQYKWGDELQYRADWKDFYNNFTKNLDELPMGNVGSDFSATYFGKAGIQSLDDFTKAFADEASDIATHVRKDIEDHVTWINRHLGDGKLDDDAIQELVEQNYDHFLNATSERLFGMMDTAGSETLPLRFADSLEQQPSRIREFKPNGESIPVNQFHKYKSKGHNIFVKEGKAFEVEPDFWQVDLANKIRTRATKKTAGEVFEQKKRERGLDKDNLSESQMEELSTLRSEVDNTIGASVRVQDGRVGYVTDFDDVSHTVRLEDGQTVRSKTVSRIPEEQQRRLEGIAWDMNRRAELENEPLLLPPAQTNVNASGQAIMNMTQSLSRLSQLEPELENVTSQLRRANTAMRRFTQRNDMTPELQREFDQTRISLRNQRDQLFEEAGELRGPHYGRFLQNQVKSLEDDIAHVRSLRENANVVDIAEASAERGARVRARQQQLDRELDQLQIQRDGLQREFSIYQRDIEEFRPHSQGEFSPRQTGFEMKSAIDRETENLIQEQGSLYFVDDITLTPRGVDAENLGYHGGNLNFKSEGFGTTAMINNDIPFTGYYFFSDAKSALMRGNRSSGMTEAMAVDFSKYNTLKPASTTEFFDIKDALQRIGRFTDVHNIENNFNNVVTRFRRLGKENFVERLENNRENIINKIRQNENRWRNRDYDVDNVLDRPETTILKEMGYEGIDVRHIPNPRGQLSANSADYGSVLFDIKSKKMKIQTNKVSGIQSYQRKYIDAAQRAYRLANQNDSIPFC